MKRLNPKTLISKIIIIVYDNPTKKNKSLQFKAFETPKKFMDVLETLINFDILYHKIIFITPEDSRYVFVDNPGSTKGILDFCNQSVFFDILGETIDYVEDTYRNKKDFISEQLSGYKDETLDRFYFLYKHNFPIYRMSDITEFFKLFFAKHKINSTIFKYYLVGNTWGNGWDFENFLVNQIILQKNEAVFFSKQMDFIFGLDIWEESEYPEVLDGNLVPFLSQFIYDPIG
jgi:hypothetical protein